MEFLEKYLIHKDTRGIFKGITNKYTWGEINLIETNANVIRGNHYHKYTKELFYILEGEIQIDICHLVTNEEQSFVAKAGMAFIIDPYENHTFNTLTHAKWINMLSHQLDTKHPDIFRADS